MSFRTHMKWLGGLVMALGCATAWAQEPAEEIQPVDVPRIETPQPVSQGPSSLTRTDVDAWLDGFMPNALTQADIVGAQVVVVKDGEILTARGFGFSDLEARTPVDGSGDMFRPGSISKLFTWIAVMQQVEAGRIDLDADVNTYLDFEIPEAFDAPITMRHLMTHTPGFQEFLRNLIIGDPELFMSLEEVLKNTPPPSRIFPPGETPGYSNYGTALAGYIVQRVSGQGFEDYVDEHVFTPMGMERATFHQPLPAEFEPYMVNGYASASDGVARNYELVPMSPAGSVAASGEAMGRFMIALLERNPEVMSAETWEQMYETIYQLTPPLNAMALGFWELDKGDLRIRGHGGDTNYFHSDLNVMLDDGVGIYVTVNSTGPEGEAGALRFAVTERFAERYFPEATLPIGPRLETAMEHGALVAGTYESSRTIETNFAAILRFAGQSTITQNADGDLVFPLFGPPAVWREVEPFVWRHVGGYERLAAVLDEDGEVAYVTFEPVAPIMHLIPAPWWRTASLVTPLLLLATVALLTTLVLWPVRAIVRWRYKQAFPLSGQDALAYRLARLGVGLVLAFLLIWLFTFMTLFANLTGMGDGFITQLYLTIASQFLLYAGLVLLLWNAFVVWTGKQSWFAKLWSVVIILASLMMLFFAGTNGLLSWETNF
jgi:CubicO group peptidase (beta-lactamase class C family)